MTGHVTDDTTLAGRSAAGSPHDAAGANPAPTDAAEPAAAARMRYYHSDSFGPLLESLGASLLVTTYQAGRLMAVRSTGQGLSMLLRSFEQPMGLALAGDRLAVGTRNQVWLLRNAADIAPQLEPRGRHDACFVPRRSHVTGDIRGHELAWLGEKLVIVNTRFSCLCTLSEDYSFVPTWQPPFITKLAAEDRCHLNGLATDAGKLRYVTALGHSDEPQGWRANKAEGGVVIEVDSGQVIAGGLSMPHSPRVYAGRLWVLDSGKGELQVVDPASGKRDTVVRLPGYARGLAFHGRYAFVGLSKIRESATFGGMPIAAMVNELKCGVWAIDLASGQVAAFFEIATGCTELFGVEMLPTARYPAVIGFEKETINGVFIVPPDSIGRSNRPAGGAVAPATGNDR